MPAIYMAVFYKNQNMLDVFLKHDKDDLLREKLIKLSRYEDPFHTVLIDFQKTWLASMFESESESPSP